MSNQRGAVAHRDAWDQAIARLLFIGQEDVARETMKRAFPEMYEACKTRGELCSSKARYDAKIEALAYLVISGQEGIAHAFLKAAHPELVSWWQLGGPALETIPPLSEGAAALVHDLTCPLVGDTGEGDPTP